MINVNPAGIWVSTVHAIKEAGKKFSALVAGVHHLVLLTGRALEVKVKLEGSSASWFGAQRGSSWFSRRQRWRVHDGESQSNPSRTIYTAIQCRKMGSRVGIASHMTRSPNAIFEC